VKKIGKEVKFLNVYEGHPRNGEGTLINLRNGDILYVFTEYIGDERADHSCARLSACISMDGGESFGDPFLMYHWNDRLVLTATYTDDTSYTTQPGDRQVEYRGKLYEISYRQSQSSENLWQPGNTYTEEITVLGMTAPVSITVKENLIKSIQIDDITMTEDIDGYWETGWDEDAQEDVEYYAYNWAEAVDSLTVTFTDNTVFTGSLAEFEDTYNLSAARGDTQSAQTPWTVGNTYSCALLVGTHQAPLSVTIAPNPVESVSFEPVILPQTDEEYYWARHLQGTVTFRDGTKAQFDPNGFLYQDESHWIDWSDDQGDNPWSAGTHTASAYVMGKEFPVTVYIGEVKTSGDYSYVLYNGKAYICDSRTGKAADSAFVPTRNAELAENEIVPGVPCTLKMTFAPENGESYSLVDYASAGKDWKTAIAAWLPTK